VKRDLRRNLALSFVITVPLLSSPSSALSRPYRCDGYIRYRPCTEGFLSKRDQQIFRQKQLARMQQRTRHKKKFEPENDSNPSVKVFDTTYEPLSEQMGLWRGKLLGEGKVYLKLVIIRSHTAESSRFMGNVVLKTKNRAVPFNFRSPLPPGKNWTWKIYVKRVQLRPRSL